MFRFIRNLISAALVVSIILISVFAVGQLIPNQYVKSYTGALSDKYDMYTAPDREPSVILVGGSNLGFGANCKRATEELGMDVINIGLHAGLKRDFELNLAKTNVLKGDIIVLALEYSAYIEDPMAESTTWYAVDGDMKVIKLIPWGERFNLLRYYPFYLIMKVKDAVINPFPEPSSEAYSREYFNEYGDLVYPRPKNLRTPEQIVRSIHIDKEHVSDESIESLKEFNVYCEGKGAKVYFSSPSVDELSVITTEKDIAEFEKYITESTGIEMISETEEYILPTEMFYDTNYHLNDAGVEKRTDLLIDDLKKVI